MIATHMNINDRSQLLCDILRYFELKFYVLATDLTRSGISLTVKVIAINMLDLSLIHS